MTRKQYRAKMRKKHGADWWKKGKKKAPAKGSFKITWPSTLRTKDGVELRYTKTGYGAHLYVVRAGIDEYAITPIGGGKYSLVWSEDDAQDEDFSDDWSGDDYIPDMVDKTILKSATPDQIKRKIESTNRPRLVKYNPRGRKRRNPRKISVEAARALMAGKRFKSGNTQVKMLVHGLYDLTLHGNSIAVFDVHHQELMVRDGGYPSMTTKERLNALPNVQVQTKKGQLYLNGKKWNGDTVLVISEGVPVFPYKWPSKGTMG